MVGQVGGENGLLDVADGQAVHARLHVREYVVTGRVEYHNAMVEVMFLHNTGGAVQLRQCRVAPTNNESDNNNNNDFNHDI